MDKKENERSINVNIEEYYGNEPIEIVLREGQASEPVQPLPMKEPLRYSVEGVISTPFDWLEKRIDTVVQHSANIQVDREEMTITLTVNENDFYTCNTFVGKVEYAELYKKLGINDESKGWQPHKLGQMFRLNRSIFANPEECMKLVSNLKNFSAKCKVEIQKMRDPNGSVAEVYKSEVESNLNKPFTINIPIFKGTPKTSIEVEFDHYVCNGEVMLQLVSPGANEVVDQYRDNCIDSVLDQIRGIAKDIAIMEV